MIDWKKEIGKLSILFCFFGASYFIIESIYKGKLTHWSMAIIGGIMAVAVGALNNYLPWEMPLWR